MNFNFKNILLVIILIFVISNQLCFSQNHTDVKSVIDELVTKFYNDLTDQELEQLNEEKIISNLSEADLKILSTKYWTFDINVTATVYIMQDRSQSSIPFWLERAKFVKTEMVVKNEHTIYTVWEKKFPAGKVELGINGFDKHRPHYFVSVSPQNKNDVLIISDCYPANQFISQMDIGSFTYHDWDELLLTEVPEILKGGKLLTTIRGRAREAHLIDAFRSTDYPSSFASDQIVLTWSNDPSTSQSIQWRTNTKIKNCVVNYWVKNDSADNNFETKAEFIIIEDRLLKNDRYINHYTVELKDLKPETIYNYQIGNADNQIWSKILEFKTASKLSKPFSFIYLGDTHKSESFSQLVNYAYSNNPDVSFFSIGGDLVSTGLNRDEWDQFFKFSENVFCSKPIMPTLGNHDSQDGLGSKMYQDLFDLPKDGPENLNPETTYSFNYENAFFLMLDVTAPIEIQTEWIENQLKNSNAKWKFVMMHFPPYSADDDYPLIQKEWCTLFDKYHVDVVFSGHVHYYLRTKALYANKPVNSTSEGTVYLISISTKDTDKPSRKNDFTEVQFGGEYLYQLIEINGDNFNLKAVNSEGKVFDKFEIKK